MKNYILSCKKCGRMYKAVKKEFNDYTTDFGDKLDKCFCGGDFEIYQTPEWVAEKVFTVKGEVLK